MSVIGKMVKKPSSIKLGAVLQKYPSKLRFAIFDFVPLFRLCEFVQLYSVSPPLQSKTDKFMVDKDQMVTAI